MSMLEQEQEYNPMQVFTYALKASESQRQYPRRFKPFLDFLKLEGSFEQQAKQFWLKREKNPSITEPIETWKIDSLNAIIFTRTKPFVHDF